MARASTEAFSWSLKESWIGFSRFWNCDIDGSLELYFAGAEIAGILQRANVHYPFLNEFVLGKKLPKFNNFSVG